MNYAIIAAGEGSRLRQEGFEKTKPLVQVGGEYLVERLIRIFKQNNAKTISIIINEQSSELNSYLSGKDWGVNINLIVKNTLSSLHSFWNIIRQTGIEECCLTTVDTIFNEREFADYISYFQANKDVDALMATTTYIDDEKPLYIQTDIHDNILAFYDVPTIFDVRTISFDEIDNKKEFKQMQPYFNQVSAGIYCLRKKAINKADDCIKANISRMRNYQRSLVEGKLKVKSFKFSKVIDVDHLEDIKKAEDLLSHFKTIVLCLERLQEYSPNSQNKDKEIINAVKKRLIDEGFMVECKNEKYINFNSEYYPLVISMARNLQVIQGLKKWEQQGCKVINSSQACLNCYRARQIRILQDNKISIPKTEIVTTNFNIENWESELKYLDCWIKRGDFQTVEKIDVVKVTNNEEMQRVLDNYVSRDINTAVISQNIEGDIVKFYGVLQTEWFYYSYPTKDKFGNIINDSQERIKFDRKEFVNTCQRAAKVLGLDVYGGDAAVDKQGKFYIIDINDFPSFSACKDEAAKNIVRILCEKYKVN
ncbi:MAG: sugar phosphate nucleotidyltransferase [Bacteroidales bacterium]